MKKLFVFLALLLALTIFSSSTTFAQEAKVTLCQNGTTISVASSAVDALIAQGATLGACASVNAPEFGMIPGIIATVSSAGAFLLLKKRSAKI